MGSVRSNSLSHQISSPWNKSMGFDLFSDTRLRNDHREVLVWNHTLKLLDSFHLDHFDSISSTRCSSLHPSESSVTRTTRSSRETQEARFSADTVRREGRGFDLSCAKFMSQSSIKSKLNMCEVLINYTFGRIIALKEDQGGRSNFPHNLTLVWLCLGYFLHVSIPETVSDTSI